MSGCRCLLFAWLLLSMLAWADTASPSAGNFPAVVSALARGDDQSALADCQQLEKAGQASFGSLYNAGLALRNLGDIPRARASFERALLLQPRDLMTRRRLRELGGQLGDKVVAADVRGTPWWKTYEAEALLWLPGLMLLALVVMTRMRGKRTAPTAILLLVTIGLSLSLGVALTAPPEHRGIVVDSAAHLLPEAKPEKPGEIVAAGTMVEILERHEHYLKIATGDGKTGWLRAAQLNELTLPSTVSPTAQR